MLYLLTDEVETKEMTMFTELSHLHWMFNPSLNRVALQGRNSRKLHGFQDRMSLPLVGITAVWYLFYVPLKQGRISCSSSCPQPSADHQAYDK